ncbi:patatin-like phospholipase family protein [Lentimicrobium sp.]|uniref:patatin-like phospholipase family protein n=1 Tax=Lentimicrobium sp. TaxID=2034841 RepID=UPI00345EB923
MNSLTSFRTFLLSTVFLLITGFEGNAQKVGLVLSGGGAKGVAHIGVIRALEEEGISIDYVTGTSMGAIIGALYASGYSPDEMQEILHSDEFKSWISGNIDEQYRYLFKESAPDPSWVDFKFKIDSLISPSLPSNIVSPILMDFAFLEIFSSASAAAGYDFDSLMVPFRCMASDVARAEAVMLKRGDLASAVRASMTFPFYFRPIRIDGKLLFDGGMYNNFPSDVMYEEFFPDIIIGSQVASNYADPKDDNVLSQLQNMLMQKQEYSVICDNGVLIRPDVPEVNVIDFSYTNAFIDSGYLMTKRMIPEIRKFIVDKVSQQQIDARRTDFNNRKPPLQIGELKVTGLRSGQYDYVNKLLGIRAAGNRKNVLVTDVERSEGVPLESIKPEYFKLIAEDKIEHIYPQLIYDDESGLFDLSLDVQRENQMIANIGGAVTSSAVNELFLQLQYNYWTRVAYQAKANAYFGRFYNSGKFEGRIDFARETPFYLEARYIFNKFNYFKTNTYFFEDEDPFYLIEREHFFTLSAGIPLSDKGMGSIDISSGHNRDDYFQTNFYTRIDTLDRTAFNFFSPGFHIEYNSLNRKEYASRGARLNAEFRFVNGREIFTPGSTSPFRMRYEENHTWIQMNVSYENFFYSRSPIHLGLYMQGFFSSQNYFSNYTSSILAAKPFQPFPEALTRFMPQFRANRFLAAGTKNVVELRKNIDFRAEAYIFLPLRAIEQDYYTRKAVRANMIYAYTTGTAALVYHSPIGPLSLNLNYYYGEDKPFSFFFKFGYLIFNDRPF